MRGPWVVRWYTRADCVTTIELRQWMPVAAFAMVLAWYVVAPTDVAAMAVGALGAMLVAAFWWARAMARGVSATRRLHYAAVQVGDELEEHITLDNATGLPVLWAEFVDRSDLPGYTVSSVRAAGSRSAIRWRAHTLCARRGLFSLGPWELRLGDPFGIFLARQTYTQPQELLVYPPLAALPSHLLPHNAILGEGRLFRQPLPADTINAASARPYMPGDPLRRIHWRTTARQERPFVRIFEPEATSTVWLIPDFDQTAHLRLGVRRLRSTPAGHPSSAEVGDFRLHPRPGLGEDDSTEETMVLLVSSLADHLLRQQLAVGLLAYAETLSVAQPRRGQPQFWRIVRALAPLHARCPWPLAETLTHFRSLLSARDLIVVITPSLDTSWPQALKHTLTRNWRGGVKAILLDPVSFGGSGRSEACVPALAEQGVAARVVRRGEVQPIVAAYGALRRWEFMTLGTGRAVARQSPRSDEPASQTVAQWTWEARHG